MRANAGIFQRLLRKARQLVAAHLFARGMIGIAADADFAAFGFALAGKHLDKLALAVARHPGDADDLAGMDGERRASHRRLAAIVEHREIADRQAVRRRKGGSRRLHGQFLGADHGACHGVGRQRL